jgi:hypothetical protein
MSDNTPLSPAAIRDLLAERGLKLVRTVNKSENEGYSPEHIFAKNFDIVPQKSPPQAQPQAAPSSKLILQLTTDIDSNLHATAVALVRISNLLGIAVETKLPYTTTTLIAFPEDTVEAVIERYRIWSNLRG